MILGADGMPAGPSATMDGAAGGRRWRGRATRSTGPNAAVRDALEPLRARSREIINNDPWALQIVRSLVANIVGRGVNVIPESPDPDFNLAAEETMKWWSEECDTRGQLPFSGLQAAAVRGMVEAGESFGIIRDRRTSDGLWVPLQIQTLESDFCPMQLTQVNQDTNNDIINGVEIDGIDRVVAYHMFRRHPGDAIYNFRVQDAGLALTRPVSADRVVHLFAPTRIGQLRGLSWLMAVILRMYELNEYEDAEIVRKKGAAAIGGFIKTPQPMTGRPDIGDPARDRGYSDANEEDRVLEGGTWQKLRPGEEIEPAQPADVGPNYDKFVIHQLRAISAGPGAMYEQVSGDYSKTNYVSYRAASNEYKRAIRQVFANQLVHQFVRPIYRAVIRTAILEGRIPTPRGFARNWRPWLTASFNMDGWEYTDPKVEVAGKRDEIRAGLNTRTRAVLERHGTSAEKLDRERRVELEREERLGIITDSNPARVTQQGLLQDVQPDDSSPNDLPVPDPTDDSEE